MADPVPTKKRAGEKEGLQVRRIGYRHAIVTPPRESSLVDINATRVQLAEAERAVKRDEAQLDKSKAFRDQIARFLASFEVQAIDRLEDDPTVPVEEPKPEPPARPREAEPVEPDKG